MLWNFLVSYKDTNPIMGPTLMTSSEPHITVTYETGALTHEFGGMQTSSL